MNRPRPSGKRVRVILLTQVIGPLDYRLPDWMDAGVGSVVVVPLRSVDGIEQALTA